MKNFGEREERENIVRQFIRNLDIASGRASALKTEIYW